MPIPIGVLAQAGAGGLLANSYELISTTTLSGTQTLVTISSIPSTYRHLQIRMLARTNDSTTSVAGRIYFNSDTAANYGHQFVEGLNGNPYASSSLGNNSLGVGYFAGATANASLFSIQIIDILDYADTSKRKIARSFFGVSNGSAAGGHSIGVYGGFWNSTSAISSVSFTMNSAGSFVSGCRFSIYGIKG